MWGRGFFCFSCPFPPTCSQGFPNKFPLAPQFYPIRFALNWTSMYINWKCICLWTGWVSMFYNWCPGKELLLGSARSPKKVRWLANQFGRFLKKWKPYTGQLSCISIHIL
jgi:hypothetical protein